MKVDHTMNKSGSGNGLVQLGNKPLPEPMWHAHAVFRCEYFFRKISCITGLNCNTFHHHIEAETKWPPFRRRHFQVNFLEWIFFKISIKISLKFVPKAPIDNIPALVQIMAWRRQGNKPLFKPMMAYVANIYASLGLNELNYHDYPRPPNIAHSGLHVHCEG